MAQLAEASGKTRWEEAQQAYAVLAVMEDSPPLVRAGEEGLSRVRDRRAVALLQDAETVALGNDPSAAIQLLQSAYSLHPSHDLECRIQWRYSEIVTDVLARRLTGVFQRDGSGALCLAAAPDPDARAICDATAVRLAARGTRDVSVIGLSDTCARALSSGNMRAFLREQPDLQPQSLVFVGKHGGAIVASLADARERRITPISRFPCFGASLGRPATQVWDKLVRKSRTHEQFRVQVWTDRQHYRIGEEVVFHATATRDCYVTLIDFQTDGSMNILLPNSNAHVTFVRAGAVVSVPAEKSPFGIFAAGPCGTEGVKALATLKPLNIAPKGTAGPFFHSDKTDTQLALCERISASVADLADGQWDVAEWSIQILPASKQQ